MKRCRCCLQTWTHGSFRRGHSRCYACEENCGVHAKRRAVDRTRAWKARLNADVAALREIRASSRINPLELGGLDRTIAT